MAMESRELELRAGELVQVRPLADILRSLDKNARLEELPFMPQMLRYCGQTLRVRKRAHKMCDTAHATGARGMASAVFLEGVHCDGQAYGGCEMKCQIVWKEAWLRRPGSGDDPAPASEIAGSRSAKPNCTEADVLAAARSGAALGSPVETYVCQATQMVQATRPLPRWEMGQYLEDYRSGNASLGQILSGLLYVIYSGLVDSGLGFGSFLRWLYDVFQKLRGGFPYPGRRGHLARGSRTPTGHLGLEQGDLVRVKAHQEILETVDTELVNRGMGFHPEMVPYCSRTLRVAQRVRKIINERTGQLMELKNPCVVLEGADCIGRYTRPLNCPRASNPYWREIWLERVEAAPDRSSA